MQVEVKTEIKSPPELIWKTITDLENCDKVISGIEEVEILEKPASGFTGTKWKETRTLFGKTATETMWITESVENKYYNTRAESHGAIYESTISLTPNGDTTTLTMKFGGIPVKLGAKIMTALMGWMFKGATVKALQKDMDDIKVFMEK